MPEVKTTVALQTALDGMVSRRRQGGLFPIIDAIAASELDGRPLPAGDASWMRMYVLNCAGMAVLALVAGTASAWA